VIIHWLMRSAGLCLVISIVSQVMLATRWGQSQIPAYLLRPQFFGVLAVVLFALSFALAMDAVAP
jgi:hypothetical protein